MTIHPVRSGVFTAVLAIPLALGACATPQQRVANKEDKLVAAGFVARPANTPQRQAMLQRLPPHKFEMRLVGSKYIYLYADPLVCGCLYVGSEAAYGSYKQMMFQQHLAEQQQMTAEMYNDQSWDMGGWGGPWGPGFGGGFGADFY